MEHVPVLLDECIEGLNIKPDGIYVDGTLGRGGHARRIVERLDTGRLIAIDRDVDAIKEAGTLLSAYRDKIDFVHGNFSDLAKVLDDMHIEGVDGMLFDLGVSSPQLDKGERGFSYMHDAPLDMRMDTSGGETAFDAVNHWSEAQLKKVFYEFGEERYAGSIARAIVKKRSEQPIQTTFDLNNIILYAIPAAARREPQHPSKRCFQGLRIAINDELGSIVKLLEGAPDHLNIHGRICVISFHSGEDRLVKTAFAAGAKGCNCPKDFPVCVCGISPQLRIITKKPITPSVQEVEQNPRARSAKLRVAERI
ncbi:MAG: 16S rRNA (cytosine(1402)-N(4))-methyltransferase RsmH [Oscillospiraceae bacterium]|nr:16S rRNA (cytosine(1402)-N(4))-methyltransferase RsmH [Oscillospiraceae bacterium]